MRAVIGGCFVAATLATSPAHGETTMRELEMILELFDLEQKDGDTGFFLGYLVGVEAALNVDRKPYCQPTNLVTDAGILRQAYRLGLSHWKKGDNLQTHKKDGRAKSTFLLIPYLMLDGFKLLFPCN